MRIRFHAYLFFDVGTRNGNEDGRVLKGRDATADLCATDHTGTTTTTTTNEPI